ncbi:unnamed protein product [Heligmosomoides polygyrus]|uniref:Ig-like domain-containing protein n=1 Tax=Heligmosomoides polygyrus TaxID=6339 RepID=A0A183GV75_HELPZ|nr:unnamed protein product [Heligmosomoides polygyrus]
MEVEETPGWFTISNGILLVWEGVCGLIIGDDIRLFKIRNEKVLNIDLHGLQTSQISSDGYWECVEISGNLEDGSTMFYYHADNTHNARLILEHLTEVTCLDIKSLTIRLDPDPLRLFSPAQMSNRLKMWALLGDEFCSEFRLVLDHNMPL